MAFKKHFKSILLLLILIPLISFDVLPNHSIYKAVLLYDCNGQQRWDVKTLQDPNANLVDFTPNSTYGSIKKIKKIVKNVWHQDDPRNDVEYQTVRLNCKILKYKEEKGASGDNDYHIVIYQGSNTSITMVAEIPKSSCPNVSSSSHLQQFINARQVIDDNDNGVISGDWHSVQNKTYTIYGVLFRDKKHGAVGQLPNFVEIHPVLELIAN